MSEVVWLSLKTDTFTLSIDSRVLSMLYLDSFHGGGHDSNPTPDVGLHFNVLSGTAISFSGTRLTYSYSASSLVRTMKEVNPPIWTLNLLQHLRSRPQIWEPNYIIWTWARGMALRGMRVVEMAGLAPAPFAGMILAGEHAQ